jgi:hypothetical protein
MFLKLLLVLVTSLSILGQDHFFERNLSNEYVRFLEARSQHDISTLCGKWSLKTVTSWREIQVPFQFQDEMTVTVKRDFDIAETYKNAKNTLTIFGLTDNAIIKLNGQIIYSYNLNGAPLKLELDAAKLYFGRKNSLEITINHLRDYGQSIPRKPLLNEARNYGGLGEIFIEHQLMPALLTPKAANAEGVVVQLENFHEDSVKLNSYDFNVLYLSSSLDTLQSFNHYFRRGSIQTDTVLLSLRLRRGESFEVPETFYVVVSAKLSSSTKSAELRSDLTHFQTHKTISQLRIIAKVDQMTAQSPFLSLERMEDDVRLIDFAGFNAIYFPYHFPHPYYQHLSEKYHIQIFVGLPTYGMTQKAFKRQENSDHIANLLLNDANPFTYITERTLPIKDVASFSSLNIRKIGAETAEYKNYAGYLNPNNEETQSKNLVTAISNSTDSYLISYFNDFYSYFPTVEQERLGTPYLEQTGLFTIDRKEKKAFRAIKAAQLNEQAVILNPGDAVLSEEYTFLIIGMLLFAIFVIGFKQATRFADNLKRTFFHAHGFFSDTRDRRILYMGQSFYLGLMCLLIAANILSAYLYYYGASDLLHVFLMYLTPDSFKEPIISTFASPSSTYFFSIINVLLGVILIYIISKLISYTGKRKINFRQLMTVIIWGFAPTLLLIPVAMFAYNTLQNGEYTDWMNYFVAFILFWSFLRICNGLRVIIDTTRFKVYFMGLLFSLILLGIDWGLLILTNEFNDYAPYFITLLGSI